jgi:hypothetical protein
MKRLFIILLLSLSIQSGYAKCGVPTTKRGNKARHEFMKQTGYPNGRKGWVVDHIVPLCRGGGDVVSNLQWQTAADAKAKDKIECKCPVTAKPARPHHS